MRKRECCYEEGSFRGALSRLNRKIPGKDEPFVLDFVNKSQDIYKAFKPYYDATGLKFPALHAGLVCLGPVGATLLVCDCDVGCLVVVGGRKDKLGAGGYNVENGSAFLVLPLPGRGS